MLIDFCWPHPALSCHAAASVAPDDPRLESKLESRRQTSQERHSMASTLSTASSMTNSDSRSKVASERVRPQSSMLSSTADGDQHKQPYHSPPKSEPVPSPSLSATPSNPSPSTINSTRTPSPMTAAFSAGRAIATASLRPGSPPHPLAARLEF